MGSLTPVSGPASLPFAHVGLQLSVFQTHAVHMHFQVFLQAAPNAQNIFLSPACIQPSRPSEALHSTSSQQLRWFFLFCFCFSRCPLTLCPLLTTLITVCPEFSGLGGLPSSPTGWTKVPRLSYFSPGL
ncbi:unnamed protein product [Gulo gulo]|uniref:Uncharacterized protein n=1 Tax=Gulo gulo TaxID=48420 RepID=A0A9X9M0S9_GULGU|nr:unnamed protein product [Gulo gulo]